MRHVASASSESYTPGGLLANGNAVRSKKVILLAGTADLLAGTVLGEILTGGATVAAKAGGNTGNGVLTLDAVTPVLAGAKVGVYTVRFVAAAANSGTYRVEDPDGNVIGEAAVGATFSDDVKFAIADGSADFVVGDGFDITVAAGSGKFKVSTAAATDGSQIPSAILVEDSPAAITDTEAMAYIGGEFNAEALTFGAGHTAASTKAVLRDAGIYTR